MKEIIEIEGMSKAGPYSLAVRADTLVFLSGQTGEGTDFSTQFNNAMGRIVNILERSNSSLENVVKVVVYLSNSKYFAEMNSLYSKYFKDRYPARTTVIAGFPNDKTMVEIDVISVSNKK